MVAERNTVEPKPLEKSTFFEQYPYVVSAPLPLRSTTIFQRNWWPTTFALGEGVEEKKN